MPNIVPRVGVLLAAFEGMHWIQQQVDSIMNQCDVDIVIYISVDFCEDGTFDYVKGLAESWKNIVVLPYGQRFGGAARNFFRLLRDVDFLQFDYVCFADQDDIWLPEKLVVAYRKLLATGADGYSSNVLAFWSSGRKVLIKKSQPQKKWDFVFEAAGPGCTYMMSKELACAIQNLLKNRWDEVQEVGLHDWFAYAFARANGYRWVIDEYAGMLYRQHEKNQVGVNSGVRAFVHRARKVLSGWGLAQSVLIARLVGVGEDPFVIRWADGHRVGVLWLALHAGQCRRRIRDKIIFALSCVALCVAGNRSQ